MDFRARALVAGLTAAIALALAFAVQAWQSGQTSEQLARELLDRQEGRIATMIFKSPDGRVTYIPQLPGEPEGSWAKRAKLIVTGQRSPVPCKYEAWETPEGEVIAVAICQHSGETYEEFCRRFQRAVDAMQEEFPCARVVEAYETTKNTYRRTG